MFNLIMVIRLEDIDLSISNVKVIEVDIQR